MVVTGSRIRLTFRRVAIWTGGLLSIIGGIFAASFVFDSKNPGWLYLVGPTVIVAGLSFLVGWFGIRLIGWIAQAIVADDR